MIFTSAVSFICFFIRIEDQLKHRSTRHFGYRFSYKTNNVDRDNRLDPFPVQCDTLVQRMIDDKIIDRKPDQLTINHYLPGQGQFESFHKVTTKHLTKV